MGIQTIKTGSTVTVKSTGKECTVYNIFNGVYGLSDGKHYNANEIYVPKKKTVALKRTPLKKSNTPIAKVSKHRQGDLQKYKLEKAKYLLKVKHLCEVKLEGCGIIASEIHHIAGKENDLLFTPSNFKAICRSCHKIITDHSKEAIENGHSVSRHKIAK